jgi:hypothetical protein
MNPTDAHKSTSCGQRVEGRKPYIAPVCRRLTPEAVKEMLLRRADTSDPEVRRMLECIEESQKKKSS